MYCKDCQQIKPPEAFYSYSPTQCKACQIVRSTAWRKANRDRYLVSHRRYQHGPKGKAKNKRYYESHKEQISEYYKAWYKANGRNR